MGLIGLSPTFAVTAGQGFRNFVAAILQDVGPVVRGIGAALLAFGVIRLLASIFSEHSQISKPKCFLMIIVGGIFAFGGGKIVQTIANWVNGTTNDAMNNGKSNNNPLQNSLDNDSKNVIRIGSNSIFLPRK